MIIHTAFTLSQHASTRMAQRGIRAQALALLLQHGTDTFAGGTCVRSRLLDRTARELEEIGADPVLIAAASKLVAIVNAEGGVVTCYHVGANRRRAVRQRVVHGEGDGVHAKQWRSNVYQH